MLIMNDVSHDVVAILYIAFIVIKIEVCSIVKQFDVKFWVGTLGLAQSRQGEFESSLA